MCTFNGGFDHMNCIFVKLEFFTPNFNRPHVQCNMVMQMCTLEWPSRGDCLVKKIDLDL